MKRATAASYLGILDKCLKQFGVEDFLTQVGVMESRIHDPTAFLNIDEFNFIIQEAYRLSGCSYLGLIFGQHLSISNHGFLGYAALTSPTLKTAIQVMLDFLNIRTGLLRGELVDKKPQQFCVEFKPLTTNKLAEQFICELAIVHLVNLTKFLIEANQPCVEINVIYKKPPYASYYQTILGLDVNFEASVTSLAFSRDVLNQPMNFADDNSFQQAKAQLEALSEQLNFQNSLPEQINKILEAGQFNLTMEQVASQLFLSPRTLRRHLQHYNINYQELLDKARQDRAKFLLAHTDLSVTAISYNLGFQDNSNFSKAFKRWTTQSPSDYRKTI